MKYEINDLLPLSIFDLRAVGRSVGVKSPTSMKRNDLIKNIISICTGELEPNKRTNRGRPAKNTRTSEQLKSVLDNLTDEGDYISYVAGGSDMAIEVEGGVLGDFADESGFYDDTPMVRRGGTLEILPEGYGFLRTGYKPSVEDIYISNTQIKRFNLRTGDSVYGAVTVNAANRKYPAIIKVESVNDINPEQAKNRIPFENLTPIYPDTRFYLENGAPDNTAMRCMDVLCPIGRGQRGLIVAPPKVGKTTLIKTLANAVISSDKKAKVFVLLVDERPEEVTDIERCVKGENVVIASSTFDESPQRHIDVSEHTLERAKRQVECGQNVVIILDSLTRLARAYNIVSPSSGKIFSGGLDLTTLYHPKRFFGAARNVEGGSSLTIIATALIDTGSSMDNFIYEEFKGSANMEMHLSKNISEKRIYPAIDIPATFTRRDELLFNETEKASVSALRCKLAEFSPTDALEQLFSLLYKTKNNEELMEMFNSNV